MMAAAVLVAAASSAAGSSVKNFDPPGVMNAGGVPYRISNPAGATAGQKGTPGTYSTDFNTNAGGKSDHFDVYGEVHTKYSQVYWTRNAPINLPPALVEKFKGKTMAITGYEVDQVTHTLTPEEQKSSTTTASQLGGFSCYPDCSDSDKSVPIYNAYNHHYFSWIVGSDAEVFDASAMPEHRIPNPTKTMVRDLPSAKNHPYPTNIVFKENPGGEFRKSYHGYPGGFAQLVHSPTTWSVEPMQIDTHNRNYGINDEVGHQPWFLPKTDTDNASVTNLHSGLSPLIECPCSDRITKTFPSTSQILVKGTCSAGITSEQECTAAVADMVTVTSSVTINNSSEPAGCLMAPVAGGKGYRAVFNTAQSSAQCNAGGPVNRSQFTWQGPFVGKQINCGKGGCLAADPKLGCTGEFMQQCTWDTPEQALAGCGMDEECQGFFCSPDYAPRGKELCFGRSVTTMVSSEDAKNDKSWIKVSTEPLKLSGTANLGGLVNMSIAHNGANATITLAGPEGVWFGVGFNAAKMADAPYAIIVDGAGKVTERSLVNHGPGDLLASSITVLSSSAAGGIRTVTVARAVQGATAKHYTLPTSPAEVNVIVAIGDTVELAYHKARTGASIVLAPSEIGACVCKPIQQHLLSYMNQSTVNWGGYNCVDEPRSDMLRHGDGTGRNVSNMACNMATYHGGLQCCKHSWFLTDVEQDALVPNKTDVYFLKWRYYFQEYTPSTPTAKASHQHLHHWVFLVDQSINDYEEDSAHYGTASIGHISAHLPASQTGLEEVPPGAKTFSPMVMTPHMHAPSAIRQEYWNADTKQIICNCTADYGDDKNGAKTGVFNEANYISIPPCIFGFQEGLSYPFNISFAANIEAHRYINNTYRHLGQMAQWTGLVVYDVDPIADAERATW